jgi:hypothetical protein
VELKLGHALASHPEDASVSVALAAIGDETIPDQISKRFAKFRLFAAPQFGGNGPFDLLRRRGFTALPTIGQLLCMNRFLTGGSRLIADLFSTFGYKPGAKMPIGMTSSKGGFYRRQLHR